MFLIISLLGRQNLSRPIVQLGASRTRCRITAGHGRGRLRRPGTGQQRPGATPPEVQSRSAKRTFFNVFGWLAEGGAARLIPILCERVHGRARPGPMHVLWTDITQFPTFETLGPRHAKTKKRSRRRNRKPKLNIKKSKKGRRAAPPKAAEGCLSSIPAAWRLAAKRKQRDFAAKHEARPARQAESKGAPRSKSVVLTQMRQVQEVDASFEAAAKKGKARCPPRVAACGQGGKQQGPQRLDALCLKRPGERPRVSRSRQGRAKQGFAAAALEACWQRKARPDFRQPKHRSPPQRSLKRRRRKQRRF